jgi:DNA-binding NarL/FixJ family response regulator
VIKFAASKNTPPEILVITVFGDERHVVSAIEAGAAGYLLKDAHPTAVADAIFQLLEGGSPITPIIARHVLKRFKVGLEPAATKGDAAPASEIVHKVHLTPRETEVLNLVSRGYSNNEIADLLKMSFHTVTSHIKHIYVKLSVRSRSEAVFEAAQMGILDL